MLGLLLDGGGMISVLPEDLGTIRIEIYARRDLKPATGYLHHPKVVPAWYGRGEIDPLLVHGAEYTSVPYKDC